MRLLLATLAICFMVGCSGKVPAGETATPDATENVADANDGSEPDSGASGDSSEGEKTIEDMRAESLAAIDQAACDAAGGEVRQEGMLGMYRCVKPYADAGKSCRGKADCEGQCRFDGDAPADGADVIGTCQVNDSPFGCYSEVEDGKLTGGICVD